ncbi:MAG: hypothetical protein V3V05_05500 [Pontiella sp.]
MQFSISDSTVSEFLGGLFAILALVGVGGILSLLLGGMTKRFPFCKLSLILALAPLSLIGFLDHGANSTLYLYAMIVILLGITIDGIAHLLEPKAVAKSDAQAKATEEESESSPGVIVWEKAE